MDYTKLKPSKLLASACTAALITSGISHAQTDTVSEETEGAKTLETIVVTGIRSTIKNALQTKRESTAIVDGIAADEIQGLPNDNIAEVIQRVPGIQIERSQGRGEQISIRGLPSRFARTTVNGQSLASSQLDGFNYGFLESEIVSGIDVYKTQRADMDEGGLAGVINIKTGDPLELSEKLTVRTEGVYSDTLDEVTPRLGASYVGKHMDGRLGIAANFVYEDAARQFDVLQIDNRFNLDTDGDGLTDTQRPRRPRMRVEEYAGDAYTGSLAFSFQATDHLRLGATGVFAQEDGAFDLTSTRVDFRNSDNLTDLLTDEPDVAGAGTSIVDQSATDVLATNVLVRREDTAETSAVMFDADYDNGVWEINANLNLTSGESFFRNDPFFFNYRVDTARFTSIAPEPYEIDDLALITNPALDDPNTFSALNGTPSNPNQPITAGAGTPRFQSSEEMSLQTDVTRHFENTPFLSSVKAGLKYRDVNFLQKNQRLTYPGIDRFAFPDYTEIARITTNDFLLQHRPDGLPSSVIQADLDVLLTIRDNQNVEVLTDQLNQFFDANRKIFAAYTMANLEHSFSGMNFRGDVGLRYVNTEQTNDAFLNGETPFQTEASYDDLLPSINTSFEPIDNLFFRAAWSETLIRPGLSANNFNRSITETQFDRDGQTFTRFNVNDGDPQLAPATAENLDLAVEYYFGDSDAVYLTYFDKTVTSGNNRTPVCPSIFEGVALTQDITFNECIDATGNVYNINRVTNSDEEQTYSGFEVGIVKAFDFLPAPFNNTGITANYTNISSDSGVVDPLSGASLPEQQLSEDSYNVRAYYDGDRFSAQLAYNFRSDFLVGLGGFLGQVRQRAERGQLDFQTSYDISDNFTVSLRALNVLGRPDYDFSATPDRFQTIGYAGRLYTLSLTANF